MKGKRKRLNRMQRNEMAQIAHQKNLIRPTTFSREIKCSTSPRHEPRSTCPILSYSDKKICVRVWRARERSRPLSNLKISLCTTFRQEEEIHQKQKWPSHLLEMLQHTQHSRCTMSVQIQFGQSWSSVKAAKFRLFFIKKKKQRTERHWANKTKMADTQMRSLLNSAND